MVRALQGPKWPEKTKDRGQVVDKINESLGSHGGDTGSKPVGTASTQARYGEAETAAPHFQPRDSRPGRPCTRKTVPSYR